jgi:hypothetical protein
MDRRFAMEAEPLPSPPGNDYQSELSLLSNDITMEIFSSTGRSTASAQWR